MTAAIILAILIIISIFLKYLLLIAIFGICLTIVIFLLGKQMVESEDED